MLSTDACLTSEYSTSLEAQRHTAPSYFTALLFLAPVMYNTVLQFCDTLLCT